jgi:hypothetical protein
VSQSLVCIKQPACEPVHLDEFKRFLEIDEEESAWDTKLKSFLVAARMDCEKYTRTRLVTQTWLLRDDAFPGVSIRYDRGGFPELRLPFPPFQSVEWFKYVDVAGQVQELTRDTTYGSGPIGFYGYQLQPGGGILPARLSPIWAKPWPPERLVPAGIMVQFRCGYGGPVTVTTTADSAVISSPGFKFHPDDAPALTGDTGTQITIPAAAGSDGTDLVTTVASVDAQGVATLAVAPARTVTGAQAWIGNPVPEPLRLAIMFHAQFFFEQGAVTDQPEPRIVNILRDKYRNMVS